MNINKETHSFFMYYMQLFVLYTVILYEEDTVKHALTSKKRK